MRLLVISSEFPPGPGGIGTHAYHLCMQLSFADREVLIMTYQDNINDEEIIKFNKTQPFNIVRFTRKASKFQNLLHRTIKIIEVIKSWKPGLIIVTGDRFVWLIAFILRFRILLGFSETDLPWVAIWHGLAPSGLMQKNIVKWSYDQPDLVISVSKYSLSQLLSLGTQPKKVQVISNGADNELFSPDKDSGKWFRTNQKLNDAFLILTVGSVTERKGHDIVIKALPEVIRLFPNTHYIIAGMPTLQSKLEKLAKQLNVKEKVHFLGRVQNQELPAIYNACDIFVLVSRHDQEGIYEGFGIVAIEAALCEKPSIVAGNSGLEEAVQNGMTGIVVPEENPSATARAIISLFSNSSLRQMMGQQARVRALESHTWEVCMETYLKAFNDVLDRSL